MGDPPPAALDLAIRCLDLTSLEGSESADEITQLCEKAMRPSPGNDRIPSVAAVVVYPPYVSMAAERLRGSGVKVATVVGFPMPTEPLPKRLAEIHAAIDAGAEEIDIVLDRDAVLSGKRDEAADEVARSKEAAGAAPLKVILETGELGTEALIRDASLLAMSAGADFLKTSTGKVGTGATPEAARVMMRAVRDFAGRAGKQVGVKVSGGIRTTDQALAYMDLLEGELGAEWLGPDAFRIGASSLLDDLVKHREASS